jgi:hypothetical protein
MARRETSRTVSTVAEGTAPRTLSQSNAPKDETRWRVKGQTYEVMARLWFDARRKAATDLGVSYQDINVEEVT